MLSDKMSLRREFLGKERNEVSTLLINLRNHLVTTFGKVRRY